MSADDRYPPDRYPEPQVASPCTGLCRIDPVSELCEGCRRTAGEIALWPTAARDARLLILQQVARRRIG